MKIARFEVLKRMNAARYLVGRVAIVGLVSTASVFLLQTNAFASGSGGLSSTIVANPLPGLVPLPLGTENGPITQSNVDLVEGNDKSGSSALDQALADGTVTAYIRSWSHRPSNGDAVVITAFQFKNAPDESSFVNGFTNQLQSQSAVRSNRDSGRLRIRSAHSAIGHCAHGVHRVLHEGEYGISGVHGDVVR
jgi:hypothetical protein